MKCKLYILHFREGTIVNNFLNNFTITILDLKNINVKIEDEAEAIIMLCFLPSSNDNFVKTFMFGKHDIIVKDVKAVLNSNKSKKKIQDIWEEDRVNYLIIRGRMKEYDQDQNPSQNVKDPQDGIAPRREVIAWAVKAHLWSRAVTTLEMRGCRNCASTSNRTGDVGTGGPTLPRTNAERPWHENVWWPRDNVRSAGTELRATDAWNSTGTWYCAECWTLCAACSARNWHAAHWSGAEERRTREEARLAQNPHRWCGLDRCIQLLAWKPQSGATRTTLGTGGSIIPWEFVNVSRAVGSWSGSRQATWANVFGWMTQNWLGDVEYASTRRLNDVYEGVPGPVWGDCFFFPSRRLLYNVERKIGERGVSTWV